MLGRRLSANGMAGVPPPKHVALTVARHAWAVTPAAPVPQPVAAQAWHPNPAQCELGIEPILWQNEQAENADVLPLTKSVRGQ